MPRVRSASDYTVDAFGSSAATNVALALPPGWSLDEEARRTKTLRGRIDHYRVLPYVDREVAAAIQAQSGLVIPIPPRAQGTLMVTPWSQDSNGGLCLGEGASGVFCIVQSVRARKFFGVKIGPCGEGTRREVAIHRELRGVAGVLQAIEFIETSKYACQVIQLAGLGSMGQLRVAIQGIDGSAMRNRIYYHIARGLFSGLANMHTKKLYHLDVKPSNVVVNHKGKVKLIDFDCAYRSKEEAFDVRELESDKSYFPPERFFSVWSGMREYAVCSGPKIDAWGAGMLLLELVTEGGVALDPNELETVLNLEFHELPSDLRQLLRGLETSSPRQRFEALVARRLGSIPAGGLGDMIRGLLRIDPNDRCTIDEARRFPWFREMERRGIDSNSFERLKELVQYLSLTRQRGDAGPQDLPQFSAMNHVHRRDLQRTLTDRLLGRHPFDDEDETALQGGHGSGKSHLATFLISQPEIRKRFGLICWFRDCSSRSSIEQQFRRLAQELNPFCNGVEFDEVARVLGEALAFDIRPCLTIFDGAGEYSMVAPYIDLVPGNGGHVIVTTPLTTWPYAIPIGPLTEEEAHRLVQVQLRREDPDISRLCEEVGCLPLTLTHACAAIRRGRITIAEYLASIGQTLTPLEEPQLQEGYRELPGTIESMYRRNLQEIEAGGATTLLRGIACLAPGEIPVEFIRCLGLQNGIDLLVHFGMLKRRDSGGYEMESLPRRLLLQELSPAVWQGAFIAAMQAFEQVWQAETEARGKLLGHGEALLSLRTRFEPIPDQMCESLATTMTFVVDGFRVASRTGDAVPYLEEVAPLARRAWSGDSAQLSGVLFNVGLGWYTLGDCRKAIPFLEEAHAIALASSSLGAGHRHTLLIERGLERSRALLASGVGHIEVSETVPLLSETGSARTSRSCCANVCQII